MEPIKNDIIAEVVAEVVAKIERRGRKPKENVSWGLTHMGSPARR